MKVIVGKWFKFMNVILLNSENFINKNTENAYQPQVGIYDEKIIHHAISVLGAKAGDELKIGEIGGNLGVATIERIDNKQLILKDIYLDTPPPPKLEMAVVLALPRPKVLRRLMMDMAAIGVRHIVLVNSFRTDKSYWSSPHLARLDEYLIEGLQQGVDTVLPTLTLARRFKPFVEDQLPALIGDGQAVVAHPYAQVGFGQFVSSCVPSVILVGAEGGFIPYEIELLASVGVVAASLGRRILRTEAAVNALLGRFLSAC